MQEGIQRQLKKDRTVEVPFARTVMDVDAISEHVMPNTELLVGGVGGLWGLGEPRRFYSAPRCQTPEPQDGTAGGHRIRMI
jgi:hypothetical protein